MGEFVGNSLELCVDSCWSNKQAAHYVLRPLWMSFAEKFCLDVSPFRRNVYPNRRWQRPRVVRPVALFVQMFEPQDLLGFASCFRHPSDDVILAAFTYERSPSQ
jgi:hypothetical protein